MTTSKQSKTVIFREERTTFEIPLRDLLLAYHRHVQQLPGFEEALECGDVDARTVASMGEDCETPAYANELGQGLRVCWPSTYELHPDLKGTPFEARRPKREEV